MGRAYERDEQGRRYCQAASTFAPVGIIITMPIDMTNADSFRKKLQEQNKIHISNTSLIVKAAADAIKDFPIISGIWLGKDKIWVPNPSEINLGCPVQIEDAIGMCFIEGADKKNLLEISQGIEAQIKEIRSKKLESVHRNLHRLSQKDPLSL
jgi:pyruvate/2-oxoglutarate dehydrogenase complex dihydrolipoamide acyltransferase (E2) component